MKVKKVAVMTWFHYHNYGTALQVTALCYIIEKLGYQAYVIRYIPHGRIVALRGYRNPKFYIDKIREKIKLRLVKDEVREKAFHEFLNLRIKMTDECKTASQLFRLNDQYDAFICGSDQIWAPTVFNSKYFLDFVDDPNKMIAYAPSIGVTEVKDEHIKNCMKECIERFKYLSVREEEGKKIIKELCGKEAWVVLDPTLLLTLNEWDSMAIEKKQNSPYILCYFLGNNREVWTHVKKLSQRTELPVKVIPIFSQDFRRGFDVINGVGPGEFLYLIKNASFVCTDSFHATLFSILYERPFYVYERFSNKDINSQNSRIYNILRITGLEDRLIRRGETKIRNNPLDCDFTQAKHRLEVERIKSLRYLENALKESTEHISVHKTYTITNTCCGCGTCSAICSQNAIEIKRDKDGFLKAFISQDKCIKCAMCKKVCPFNGLISTEIDKKKHKLFMAYSKQFEVLQTSSSGGIGYKISKLLCEEGYDVIGCIYDNEKREAIHKIIRAGKTEELHIFQGSKYLQSNIANVIKELGNNIEKAVVFGTPCQISGIDRLLKLKGKRDNFILVDLICYGVPSQNLWEKYIKEGSQKYGYDLFPYVEFRYKPKGWRKRYIRLSGNGKTYICIDRKDLFYRFFLLRHCFAPSCYECNYRITSAADIRIGDYWGPRFKNFKKGVSMVIAMTSVGEEVLQWLYRLNRIELQQMNCEEYWTVQCPENPIKPVFYNKLMDELRNDSISLKEIADKYCKGFEWDRKIYSIYTSLKSVYKKIRSI